MAEVWIEIQDEGPGVTEDDLPRLFDHFYRTDKSRSRQSGGSGFGLSLARQFMEVHGGTIAASNRSSGGLSVRMGFGSL
jgi:signal transduction histidine kinase